MASLAFCLGLVQPALAVESPLSKESVDEAIASGSAMARRGEGYTLGDYVLYSADDGLRVADEHDPIEAIAVGTPYERLRFQAYLLTHQAKPFGKAAVAEFNSSHTGVVEFVLFLHSRPNEGADFLSHYGSATLSRPGATPLSAQRIERTIPVSDMYLGPGSSFEARWLGQLVYRFRLNAEYGPTDRVTFAFTDDRGVAHTFAVELARYR